MKAKKARKATKRIDPTVADQEDLAVSNHGTVFLLSATSEAGKQWLRDNIAEENAGFSVVVEHRYIADIIDGAKADGLIVTKA